MTAFALNVYNDQHLATRAVSQILQHCPASPIIIISDGIPLQDDLKKHTLWFEHARVKSKGMGGLWTHRYLSLFLEHTSSSHLLRIDPDTCVHRPFKLPEGDYDIFGTPGANYSPYIRGGCIGFTRACAETLVKSRRLLAPIFAKHNYARYSHYKWPHEEYSNEPLAFQDYIVADLVKEFGFKIKQWDEVNILGNLNTIPEAGNFAITHPHPWL